MTRDQEAQSILKRIKADDFFLLQHADQRSQERGITKDNIIQCAKTCFHWEWQEKHGTHFFLGSFNESEEGGFTAVLKDQVLVVTIFRRRLKQWEKNKKP